MGGHTFFNWVRYMCWYLPTLDRATPNWTSLTSLTSAPEPPDKSRGVGARWYSRLGLGFLILAKMPIDQGCLLFLRQQVLTIKSGSRSQSEHANCYTPVLGYLADQGHKLTSFISYIVLNHVKKNFFKVIWWLHNNFFSGRNNPPIFVKNGAHFVKNGVLAKIGWVPGGV